MKFRFTGYRAVALVFWVLAIGAVLIWGLLPRYIIGWDLRVYGNAITSLRAGHDPYSDGIAVQRIYHEHLAEHQARFDATPFTYVYSPLTLPVVRLLATLPLMLSNTVYWVIYGLATLAAIFVGLWAAEDGRERRIFSMVAPAVVFFPGLLQNDVLFSGNVAYILYGVVLLAALAGWRKGQWVWFYAAVFLASCCKAPLLTLLAIPVLSARRQWWPALATGVAGLAAFAVQPAIWPVLFKHYMEAVELQFSFNHDFSSSPAGLLTDALYDHVNYKSFSTEFYLLYAIPAFGLLYWLSRQYFAGRFTLKQWVPVVMVGTVFINPRIMEYDVAPITMMMALVAWRFCMRSGSLKRATIEAAVLFAVAAASAAHTWRPTESVTLTAVFAAGCWQLVHEMRAREKAGEMSRDGLRATI